MIRYFINIFKSFSKSTKVVKKKEKTQLEYNNHIFKKSSCEKSDIKNYVMEFLTDSGIDLSTVYVQDVNRNGCCVLFKKTKTYDNDKLFDGVSFSNVFNKDEIYLILPELKEKYDIMDYIYTASVWIHEIAHYIFKHNDTVKPVVVKEYEACLYSEKMLEKMPIYTNNLPDEKNKYFLEYGKKIANSEINIRKIYLDYVKLHNRTYVKSFYDKLPNVTKDVFVNKEIKDYIKSLKNH